MPQNYPWPEPLAELREAALAERRALAREVGRISGGQHDERRGIRPVSDGRRSRGDDLEADD